MPAVSHTQGPGAHLHLIHLEIRMQQQHSRQAAAAADADSTPISFNAPSEPIRPEDAAFYADDEGGID